MFIFVPPSLPLPRAKTLPPKAAPRIAYFRGIPAAVWIKALGRRPGSPSAGPSSAMADCERSAA
jgi:hypothetical protein